MNPEDVSKPANGGPPAVPVLRPDLPDWGAFPRWPDDGDQWIHPEDLERARKLLPSERVFRREKWDGEFYWLYYGELHLRTRPVMWLPVPAVDLQVGQQVELLARHGENDPGVFRVHEIFFNVEMQIVEFCLERDRMPLAKRFSREDLRPLHIHYELRAGFFEHEEPKAKDLAANELLDVGDLLDDN